LRKVLLISLLVVLFLGSSGFSANPSLKKAQVKAKLKTIAVPFIENRGQVDAQVAYVIPYSPGAVGWGPGTAPVVR
jgi:hypothetical protein